MPEIPWQCWESPGFKDCHAKQWAEVRELCRIGYQQAGYPDMQSCMDQGTVVRAIERCGALCPVPPAPLPSQINPFPDSDVVFYGQRKLTTNTKIMLGAAAAVIVVLVLTRKR